MRKVLLATVQTVSVRRAGESMALALGNECVAASSEEAEKTLPQVQPGGGPHGLHPRVLLPPCRLCLLKGL